MSFCLTCGKNATAIGIGCVSVGDGVHTQGAWQVAMGPDLTVEELGPDPKIIREQILTVKGLMSLYQSFSDQGFAPASFFPKAKAVLEHLIGIMTRRAEELEEDAKEDSTTNVPKEKEEAATSATAEVMEEVGGITTTGGTSKKRRNRNRNKK